MTQDPQETTIPFSDVLEALKDIDTPFPARMMYRFSDLEGKDLEALRDCWIEIPEQRRLAFMQDIEEMGMNDFLLDFGALCGHALADQDGRIRALAVRGLWEYEQPALVPEFLRLAAEDPHELVRAAAVSALGKYVFLGEIEDLRPEVLDEIVDTLIEMVNSSDTLEVRRRAVEALGFSSREEIAPILERAYYEPNRMWRMSALFAMGRSANSRWNEHVLEQLENDDDEIRFEAARASGELEIKAAAPILINLLDDPDREVRFAAIWSLSQIGGEDVAEALEAQYDQAEDEEEIELIDSAMDNLAFTEGMEEFTLLDLPEDDDDIIFDNFNAIDLN
jgi:hypothetical protein